MVADFIEADFFFILLAIGHPFGGEAQLQGVNLNWDNLCLVVLLIYNITSQYSVIIQNDSLSKKLSWNFTMWTWCN